MLAGGPVNGTVAFGDRSVELLLADSNAEQLLVPSGDNIAVLFPPERVLH